MTSKNEINEIKKELGKHEKRLNILEKFIEKPIDIKEKMSIKGFIIEKAPKNDVDRALAIGYYLEKYESYSSFNANDLVKGYQDARCKVPVNPWDKIQINLKKNYIMDADEEKDGQKSYVLTIEGEKYVKNYFKKSD